MNMLEWVKQLNQEWVRSGYRLGYNTNNVSATVPIRDDEWEKVGRWMWENKASYNGLSVLPYDSGNYKHTSF
jgi:ribonucleoside-diphosphate reductase alpha chain